MPHLKPRLEDEHPDRLCVCSCGSALGIGATPTSTTFADELKLDLFSKQGTVKVRRLLMHKLHALISVLLHQVAGWQLHCQ